MAKAQIKMAETVAILVVFFMLLMFGLSFYVGLQQENHERLQEETRELNALQIIQKASYLPELQCSIQNIQYDNCFDVQKADQFYRITHGPGGNSPDPELIQRYYQIFRHSTIYLHEIYPGNGTVCVYDQALPVENATYAPQMFVPVSLYNATENAFSMGMLNITYTVS